MGLKSCKDCGHEVSSRAESCPNCGGPVKRRSRSVSTGCGCLVMLIAGVLFIGIFSNPSDTPRPASNGTDSTRTPSSSTSANKWYVGGTLHRAQMREWSRASYSNRLATCADFVTGQLQREGKTITSVDELRPLAEKLELNISAANEGGAADNQDVSEIAALIWAIWASDQ